MVLILSGITWAAFSQQRSEPENRTGQKTDSSLMLTAEGNSLKVSEKVKDNIKKENKTKKERQTAASPTGKGGRTRERQM